MTNTTTFRERRVAERAVRKHAGTDWVRVFCVGDQDCNHRWQVSGDNVTGFFATCKECGRRQVSELHPETGFHNWCAEQDALDAMDAGVCC